MTLSNTQVKLAGSLHQQGALAAHILVSQITARLQGKLLPSLDEITAELQKP